MASTAMKRLIRELNSPRNQGNSEAINEIQKQLQRLQSDSTAWQGALDLLTHDDNILRFYGALTLSQKINADWDRDKIGEHRDLLSQLTEQLVMTYVKLAASEGTTDLVISKLSQVLAAIFAKPDAAWAFPCRHILACLLAGHYMQQTQLPSMADILAAKTTLPARSLKAVLRLALALHEEIAATSHNPTNHRTHVQLSNNAIDMWQIFYFTLASFSERGEDNTQESSATLNVDWSKGQPLLVLRDVLQQIQHWIRFVATDSVHTTILFDLFQSSMQKIFTFLDQGELSVDALLCITAVQNEDDRLLARTIPNHINLVNSSSAVKLWTWQAEIGELETGPISYVDFLESIVSRLEVNTDAFLEIAGVTTVLQNAVTLLNSPGIAVIEDPICHTLLEMMTTIAEGYSDWPGASKFDKEMSDLLKSVCTAIFNKITYPPNELDKQTKTWDQDEFTMFEDFRFDASDFFQTAFGIVGPDLVMNVIVPASGSPSLDWAHFESTIFVLTCVTDALSNEPERCDPCLTQLFDSPTWAKAVGVSEQTPSLVKLAMIKLLGESTSFLQRHSQHLLGCLDFLFRSLQIRNQTGPASKAIYNLCDKQRIFLSQGLPQFLATLTTIDHIPLYSRVRILSAVSSLIQALDSETEKIEPLQKMLLLLHNKMISTSDNTTAALDDEPPDPNFEHLSMLAAIARGLQSPSEVPVDLEDTEPEIATFWIEGPGQQIQKGVLQMIAAPWSRLLLPESSDLVTPACEFLKAGFKEQHPSPFKFDNPTNIELLSPLIDLQNPNLDQTMMATACYVASTNTSTLSPSQHGADVILPRVVNLIRDASTILTAHDNNSSNTNHAQSSSSSFATPTSPLDFLVRIFQRGKWGLHLFSTPTAASDLSSIIEYSLLLLRNADTFPRRSAAVFFSALLDLTDPSSPQSPFSQTHSTSSTAAEILTGILQTYSPNVLGLAIHLLAGECARSELEILTETLRKFIQRQPMPAKRILQEAMKPESGVLAVKALQATKPEQRARFIAQVEALRGAKRTNELVREFWTTCRGAQFGYVT